AEELQARSQAAGSPAVRTTAATFHRALRRLTDGDELGPPHEDDDPSTASLRYGSTTYRIVVKVLRREYGSAWAEAEPLSHDWRRQLSGAHVQPIHALVVLIAAAEQLPATTGRARIRLRRLMREHRRVLESWAGDCPENYAPMLALAQAELAGLAGRYREALTNYEHALARAEAERMPWLAGLAADRLAARMTREGHTTLAEQSRARARALYRRWGALALALTLALAEGERMH
ncbi:MAG: hypothetical protein KC431_12715, partial [Myxococcales bacterium]|nr:hypothetical protein [Myxococcales bacterium]